jgi:hypothetical protein
MIVFGLLSSVFDIPTFITLRLGFHASATLFVAISSSNRPSPKEERMEIFCGIDWSEDHHDISLVDRDGQLPARRRISDDTAGLAQLLVLLADHGDSFILASVLGTDLHAHRPLPAGTELAQAIAVLARAQQDAVWDRTSAHNKLRSHLREYFPQCSGIRL